MRRTLAALVIASIGLTAAGVRADGDLSHLLPRLKPTEPGESLKTFRIAAGFKLELVAAEPLVTDPVDVAWDEDGRMYVCELWNYPGEPKPGEPLGRVRLLESSKADGVYDRSTIFADHLKWPSGVICWDGGVFVLSSPDLLYLKRVDGKLETRRVFTGFRGKTYEVPNSLRWGPDGMIYVCGSYAGGKVTPVAGDARVPPAEGRSFRFDPRKALTTAASIEAISAGGEWGLTLDDFGNVFTCDATHLCWHAVLPRDLLARNEYLAVPQVQQACLPEWAEVYPISPPEPWKQVRQQFWSKWVNTNADMNAGRFPKKELDPHGFATSASGLTVYRGSAYGKEYAGDAFIGEPANNVVVRLKLSPDGVGFKASRPDAQARTEFLASTDNWFRPVNFANGPDGCLYVVAMYREVIEDESAVPNDILKHLDLYSGRERGRIYRIVPDRADWQRPAMPKMGSLTSAHLVEALKSPDGWVRDTAQRLLLTPGRFSSGNERGATAAGLLAVAQSTTTPAASRSQAIWTLAQLRQSIRPFDLDAMLDDADPRVREQAIWAILSPTANGGCAVPFVPDRPATAKLPSLADDADSTVRLAAAFAFGAVQLPPDEKDATRGRICDAFVRLARRDAGDPWLRTVIIAGSRDVAGDLFAALAGEAPFASADAGQALLGDLAQTIGARGQPSDVAAVLDRPTAAVIARLARGMNQSGNSLAAFLEAHPPGEPARAKVRGFFDAALATALDASKTEAERRTAIDLLAFDPFRTAKDAFGPLLAPAQPQAIQVAAIKSIATRADTDVPKLLVDQWRHLGPSVRPEVVDALLRRPERIPALLDAMEHHVITPADLGLSKQSRLLKSGDAATRERAKKLFGSTANADRQAVIDKYRAAIRDLKGDAERGKVVFQNTCFQCHSEAPGHPRVGPNLGALEDRSPDTLLINILDPNRDVKPIYVGYSITTTDGQDVSGVIAAESASSVTIRNPAGDESVLRKNIKTLTSSGLSLMPDGLEGGIDPQQMADLITFLQGYRGQ